MCVFPYTYLRCIKNERCLHDHVRTDGEIQYNTRADTFVGAVGFCYGGWAAFRLGAREHQPPLVDCISVGHPSLLTRRDIDEVAVPVQVLAPEHDPAYTAELRAYTCDTVPRLGVPFLLRYFPGVEHACFCRGDASKTLEREALVAGKKAVVDWVKEFMI